MSDQDVSPLVEHASLSVSESSGVQNYMSTSSSYRRLRSSSHSATPSQIDNSETVHSTPSTTSIEFHSRSRWSKSKLVQCIRWLGMCYVFISIVFALANLAAVSFTVIHKVYSGETLIELPSDASFLSKMAPSYRLSRLTSIYPTPSFEPNVLLPGNDTDNSIITACLWIEEVQLDSLGKWMITWKGYASILVMTLHGPSTPQRKKLRQKILAIASAGSTRGRVALHIVQTHRPAPNAFLNLARLFSPSKNVLILPTGLQSPVQTKLYDSIIPHLGHLSEAPVLIPSLPNSFLSKDSLSWSSIENSPHLALFIDRNVAPWCPERFFSSASAEWIECLWVLWFTSFGNMNLLEDGWSSNSIIDSINSLPAAEVRIHERLSSKHRAEVCMMMARQVFMLGQWPVNSENGRKSDWVRSVCVEPLALWSKDLIE